MQVLSLSTHNTQIVLAYLIYKDSKWERNEVKLLQVTCRGSYLTTTDYIEHTDVICCSTSVSL